MKKRTGIIILLIVMLGSVSLAAPALASAALNRYEKQLLRQVNKQRANHHLAKLRLNTKLVRSAKAHSADMAARKYFRHNTPAPNSEVWSRRIIRCGYTNKGYRYWKAGENISYGAGLYSSPVNVVDAWMRSKAHRAVILTKAFRDIGVGAVKTPDGYGSIDTTVWFFTLDLGRRIAR